MSCTIIASKLNALINLAKVCSKDQTRYKLTGVHSLVRGDHVEFQATDGHMMARLKIAVSEFEGDLSFLHDKIIPQEFFKALKNLKKEAGYATAEFNGKAKLSMAGSVQEFPFIEDKFPDVDAILSDKYVTNTKLSFNADYLLTLAQALNTQGIKNDQVTLHIQASLVNKEDGNNDEQVIAVNGLNPIYVTRSGNDSEAFAVLMPMRMGK